MIRKTYDELIDLFRGRRFAYTQVFQKNRYTDQVLKDLSQFCRANVSAFHMDPRAHAMMEGRREVWLRIQNYLQLSEEDLFKMHKIHEEYSNETARTTRKISSTNST